MGSELLPGGHIEFLTLYRGEDPARLELLRTKGIPAMPFSEVLASHWRIRGGEPAVSVADGERREEVPCIPFTEEIDVAIRHALGSCPEEEGEGAVQARDEGLLVTVSVPLLIDTTPGVVKGELTDWHGRKWVPLTKMEPTLVPPAQRVSFLRRVRRDAEWLLVGTDLWPGSFWVHEVRGDGSVEPDPVVEREWE